MTHVNPAEQSSTDLSLADGMCAIPDLLDSPNAFEVYLADVRRRRELHREQRRRQYWQSAILRLGEELEAARAEQDEVIANELTGMLTAFERALATVAPSDDPAAANDHVPLPKADEQVPDIAPAPPQPLFPRPEYGV